MFYLRNSGWDEVFQKLFFLPKWFTVQRTWIIQWWQHFFFFLICLIVLFWFFNSCSIVHHIAIPHLFHQFPMYGHSGDFWHSTITNNAATINMYILIYIYHWKLVEDSDWLLTVAFKNVLLDEKRIQSLKPVTISS